MTRITPQVFESLHYRARKMSPDFAREIERLRRVLTEIMESAEHHDADACHEMARLALRWPQQ